MHHIIYHMVYHVAYDIIYDISYDIISYDMTWYDITWRHIIWDDISYMSYRISYQVWYAIWYHIISGIYDRALYMIWHEMTYRWHDIWYDAWHGIWYDIGCDMTPYDIIWVELISYELMYKMVSATRGELQIHTAFFGQITSSLIGQWYMTCDMIYDVMYGII